MQRYTVTSGQGIEGLRRGDLAPPALQFHETRVRVAAASLNYRDLIIADGQYLPPSHPIFVPLSDGAGEVVEVGDTVTRFRPGDRVVASFWPSWIDGPMTAAKTAVSLGFGQDGFLAETFTYTEGAFVAAPRTLSMAEASTLPCAGVTAWNALFVEGRLKPGASVLILGTGGVALWALQLAVAAGCRAILLSSSDEKLGRAKALGAADTLNYRTTPEWQHNVLALTNGEGVDLVVEVGGQGTLARSIEAVRVGGTVVVIGGLSGFGDAGIGPGMLIGGAKRLVGVSVGSRAMLEDLVRFVDVAGIKPVVHKTFAFGAAADAYAALKSGTHLGKIVVNVAN